MQVLTAILLGISSGFVAGLLPNVNLTLVIIMIAPLLPWNDLFVLLCFYIAASSATQYAGSISALLFGFPGETTSLPAMRLRRFFSTVEDKKQAIYNTAAGSLIGAMVSLVLGMVVCYAVSDYTAYLRTSSILLFTTLALIFCISSSDNRWWESIAMILLGFLFRMVGNDMITGENFGTFGNPYLMTGIPMIAVMAGLMVLPVLLSCKRAVIAEEIAVLGPGSISFFSWDKLTCPALRGSIIGFLAGLIPFVGSSISSTVAYSVEKHLNEDPLAQITSAETADNSAYFSALIPLLLFGIAIVPSEAVMLNMINRSTTHLSWASISPLMFQLGIATVVINLICFVMSYNLVDLIVRAYLSIERYLVWIIGSLMILIAYQNGAEQGQGLYFLVMLALMSVLGYLLRNKDTVPILFAFLVQETLFSALTRTMMMIKL